MSIEDASQDKPNKDKSAADTAAAAYDDVVNKGKQQDREQVASLNKGQEAGMCW